MDSSDTAAVKSTKLSEAHRGLPRPDSVAMIVMCKFVLYLYEHVYIISLPFVCLCFSADR